MAVVDLGARRVRIPGWILGRDGKRDEYWETVNGRSAYWVPQAALNPDLGDLPR